MSSIIEIPAPASIVELIPADTKVIEILTGPPGADGPKIHVGTTPPEDPEINDLWVDTN
jgi:hypothetical protein